jgi:hypothetical protein
MELIMKLKVFKHNLIFIINLFVKLIEIMHSGEPLGNYINMNFHQNNLNDCETDQIDSSLDKNVADVLTKDISKNSAFEHLNSVIRPIEGQQIKLKDTADEEAIKKYEIENCYIAIRMSDFDRLVKKIKRVCNFYIKILYFK